MLFFHYWTIESARPRGVVDTWC